MTAQARRHGGTGVTGSHTATLAEWVAGLKHHDLPAAQRAQVRRVLLDGLGCGLYGSGLPWSARLAGSLRRLGAGGAHVLGSGRELPADRAALLNGSYIQAYELDDYHQDAGIHSAACVVPAAMAAADLAGGVTGARFVTAVAAGFEVGSRVGRCLDPTAVVRMGWHSGSVFAPLAAAAAAAVILELDAAQVMSAFGIAATQAGGLGAVQYGSMVKRMQHGRGAQSGLYGALLAADGYTGIADVFDQEYGGYCTTFVKDSPADLDQLTDGLGDRFWLDRIGIKPYSCNAGIHATLDAVREIVGRAGLTAADVESVTVAMSRANQKHVGWPYREPSETAAQMNLPFCVAALLVHGDVFIEQFSAASVRSPELAELASRVTTVHNPAFDELGPSLRHHVEVTVTLRSGRAEVRSEDYGRGSPMRPLADADVLEKFGKLATLGRARADAAELARAVLGLEQVEDVAALLGRLVTRPAAGPNSP
jgi:aconitate decarboxylase